MSRNLALLAAPFAAALLALSGCAESRAAASGGGGSGCVGCHGEAARVAHLPETDANLKAAPPIAPAGAPGYAVGAHQGHLNPTAEAALAAPIACNECHVVPTTAAHSTNPPAQKVVFGTRATTQGNQPVWSATNTTCSSTYCHGGFAFGAVQGNRATPQWTDPAMECTSCHGMPPVGHPPLSGTVTAATCAQCHPDTVNVNGTINVAGGKHVNGEANVAFSCTSCHGDATRTNNQPMSDADLALLRSSPPVAPSGAPAYAVGAHQAHLNPATNGSFRAPLACSECHVVPTTPEHAVNPPSQRVVFGTLATARGATPSWNVATTSCSATYCHGKFDYLGIVGASGAPSWTATNLTCTSCHGLPPTGHPALAGTVTAATCNGCHPSTVNPDGSINVASGTHINGEMNVTVGCTNCHGEPARQATTVNPQLPAAPPVAAPGTNPRTVGLHLVHLQDSVIRSAVECNNCHVVPGNPDHAVTKPTVIQWSSGTLATTQGAAPVYNVTTFTCATTYCHGAFTFNAVTGNTAATAAWDSTPTYGCTGCHGMPPTGHFAIGTPPVAATACAQCHPDTVNANGTINVAGGKHMDGLAQYSGNHPANWATPTVHGYAANTQGMPSCTGCHVNYESPAGTTAGSCNTCHANAGVANWQTNCTFCHGTPGRAFNQTLTSVTHPAPTLALLAASPPVGPLGETSSAQGPVGAHQRHVNPLTTDHASPFECGNCHGTTLPTDVSHVNGQLPTVPFGLIAVTGNVRPAINFTTLTCTATYCHGNFTGGAPSASVVWTSTTAMTCSSCHPSTPTTGQHPSSNSKHATLTCAICHGTGYLATRVGTGPYNGTDVTGIAINTHVNGIKNVGGTGSSITTWNATAKTCTPVCHSQKNW